MEELMHYMIARNAIEDPYDILCPYAKPGFTIIATFLIFITNDYFGLTIIRVMTIIFTSISTYYCYKTLILMKYSNRECILGAGIFNIIQTNLIYGQSAIIEPLAVMLIIMGYYYFKINRYNLSSIIFSYSFLVRNETIFIICILGLWYFFKQKKIIPIIIFASLPVLWVISLELIGYGWLLLFKYNTILYSYQIPLYEIPTFRYNFISFIYYLLIFLLDFYNPLFFLMILASIYYLIKDKDMELYHFFMLSYFVYLFFGFMKLAFNINEMYRHSFLLLSFSYIYILLSYKKWKLFASKLFSKYIEYHFQKRAEIPSSNQTSMINEERIKLVFSLCLLLVIFGMSVFKLISITTPSYYSSTLNQIEMGTYLKNNVDLRDKRIFLPLGLYYIYTFFEKPYIYDFPRGEYNYTGSSSVSFFQLKGYFYLNIKHVDLNQELQIGDIIIWFEYYNENLFLNPIYVNSSRYQSIYECNNGMRMIAYQVIA